MKQALLEGDKKNYKLQGVAHDAGITFFEVLKTAETNGITKITMPFTKVYLELRSDGWWRTSDYAQCDTHNGLPPEGLKINLKKYSDD